jgi:hypothetical protein
MTADYSILLRGGASQRALELTLDSAVGQTEDRFLLFAVLGDIGAEGAALMARYDDDRFMVVETVSAAVSALAGRFVALLQAGDVWAPGHVEALEAALDAAPGAVLAAGDATYFDGVTLRAARKLPGDAAGLGAALRQGLSPPVSTLLIRNEAFLRVQAALADVGALCRALLDGGGAAVPVTFPRAIVRVPEGSVAARRARRPATLYGRTYTPADVDADRPPTLYVVVDTEAEFDWAQPFATDLTAVSALSGISSAQAIFDRYRLRPVYVVDYPVASKPAGVEAIRAIADKGGCAVGAHLHPWANPPFGEDTSRRLSFPGNLPSQLEAAKLDALLEVIGRNFAVTPAFYKAGRYGLGPNTAALIASRGARVDFSLLPQTDLRHQDGPDFSGIDPIPYHVDGTALLTLPMTRAHVGALSGHRGLNRWLDGKLAGALHVPGVLARTGMLERLTLTPEGVPAAPQIRLIRALLAQGHRMFVLHFHSPSLVAGHTPYVRTEADRVDLLSRIETVCRWFFEELGGLPGRPWDLLEPAERKRP